MKVWPLRIVIAEVESDCQTDKHKGCCEMINLGGLQESGEEDWMKGSLMTGVGGGSGKSWSWNCPKLDNFPSVRPYPGLAFPETGRFAKSILTVIASVSAEIAVRFL